MMGSTIKAGESGPHSTWTLPLLMPLTWPMGSLLLASQTHQQGPPPLLMPPTWSTGSLLLAISCRPHSRASRALQQNRPDG